MLLGALGVTDFCCSPIPVAVGSPGATADKEPGMVGLSGTAGPAIFGALPVGTDPAVLFFEGFFTLPKRPLELCMDVLVDPPAGAGGFGLDAP